MSKDTDPFIRKKTLPAAVLALAASTLISACGAYESHEPTPKELAASARAKAAAETARLNPIAQRLGTRIRAIYAQKPSDDLRKSGHPNYFQKNIIAGDGASDTPPSTTLLLEVANAGSNIPGYTGNYSAYLNVADTPSGTPDYSKINVIIIEAKAMKAGKQKGAEVKELDLYNFQIDPRGDTASMGIKGTFNAKGGWEINDYDSSKPSQIETPQEYAAAAKQAETFLDAIEKGDVPVDFTLPPS